MQKKIFKILLFYLSLFIIFSLFLGGLIFKLTNHYRPSIYNYESYLHPQIVNNLKKNYNYKEFKEINEFTQALTQDKAIAGVGSDFQTAQLILDKKIKKINFERIFGSGTNKWDIRKTFFTKNVQNHLENFDKLIYNKLSLMSKDELNKMGFEINKDNQKWRSFETRKENENNWDHFSDFIIPYYIQDKGVAYNINKNSRPNLEIEKASKILENIENPINWNEIFSILKDSKYQRVAWTNAFIDNLMIGALNYKANNPDEWKTLFTHNGEGKLFNFNDFNYKIAIDSFIKFVEDSSGFSIKNTGYNYLSGDGLELLNHLIEPKEGRSDSAVIYNGDALDAYYSRDNFASVEDGLIRFIRPKYNYLLMDGWVISHKLSEEDTNNFLDILKENVYHNNFLLKDNIKNSSDSNLLDNLLLKKVKDLIDDEIRESAFKTLKQIFDEEKDTVKEALLASKEFSTIESSHWDDFANWEKELNNFLDNNEGQYWNWLLIVRNNSDKGYSLFEDAFTEAFGDEELSEIANFDYISYTPADKLSYEFIEKWYFGNDKIAKDIFAQPSSNDKYFLFTYPIIDNSLRTKIASYYFETTKS